MPGSDREGCMLGTIPVGIYLVTVTVTGGHSEQMLARELEAGKELSLGEIAVPRFDGRPMVRLEKGTDGSPDEGIERGPKLPRGAVTKGLDDKVPGNVKLLLVNADDNGIDKEDGEYDTMDEFDKGKEDGVGKGGAVTKGREAESLGNVKFPLLGVGCKARDKEGLKVDGPEIERPGIYGPEVEDNAVNDSESDRVEPLM
ncbi:MAG: hypothetical protein M1834_000738 [Cirrosporium novae-zelandiae]|nr:MAG: hypothetical protein M1834_000738 [Cirrosporium novae-zelandiae]